MFLVIRRKYTLVEAITTCKTVSASSIRLQFPLANLHDFKSTTPYDAHNHLASKSLDETSRHEHPFLSYPPPRFSSLRTQRRTCHR